VSGMVRLYSFVWTELQSFKIIGVLTRLSHDEVPKLVLIRSAVFNLTFVLLNNL